MLAEEARYKVLLEAMQPPSAAAVCQHPASQLAEEQVQPFENVLSGALDTSKHHKRYESSGSSWVANRCLRQLADELSPNPKSCRNLLREIVEQLKDSNEVVSASDSSDSEGNVSSSSDSQDDDEGVDNAVETARTREEHRESIAQLVTALQPDSDNRVKLNLSLQVQGPPQTALDGLSVQIGYSFKDSVLLKNLAFIVVPSPVKNNPRENLKHKHPRGIQGNENLVDLGKEVLVMAIADHLQEHYINVPIPDDVSNYVTEPPRMWRWSQELGLPQLAVYPDRGREGTDNLEQCETADLLLALFGAVYLDGGEVAIHKILGDLVDWPSTQTRFSNEQSLLHVKRELWTPEAKAKWAKYIASLPPRNKRDAEEEDEEMGNKSKKKKHRRPKLRRSRRHRRSCSTIPEEGASDVISDPEEPTGGEEQLALRTDLEYLEGRLDWQPEPVPELAASDEHLAQILDLSLQLPAASSD